MTRSGLGPAAIAVVSGVALGWLGAGPLAFLAWGNILVWGAATVAVGMVAGSRGEKVVRLSLYGFSLGFAFMCFGYDGQASLLSRTPFFAAIGLFCAVCAVLVGGVVHGVRSRVAR